MAKTKIMRIPKIIYVFLATITIITAAEAKAYADVIHEPVIDVEISNEYHQMSKPRKYIMQNDCNVYNTPGGKIIGKFYKGNMHHISYLYDTDTKTWGGFSSTDSDTGFCWVDMSDCELVYDNISFMEDHRTEFVEYKNELIDYKTNDPIYLWLYPGSETAVIMEQYPPEWNEYISHVYIDNNNHKWGYIGYIWHNEGWIYMDSPAENITNFDEKTTINSFEQDSAVQFNRDFAPALLAASTAVISAILLKTMRRML